MLAPLALAMLPASSVTLSTELIGPSVRLVRSAVPAEASTVTWLVPSLKVTFASAPATSASMPDTVKATAVFSALLIVVSVIDSVNGAPRSALVSRSMLAPLALAMLPASSVTLSTELIGPSVRLVRSAVPAEASTVTWLVPSLKVTFASAPATSASMPDTVKATAVFSALLIVVSVIDSVNGAPRSALVSRSMLAPLALAMLPASSVTLSTELIGPSVRLVRSAVPAEASTVTWLVPSLKVTFASAPATSASMPDTVKATAVFSALLIVVSVIDSVNGAPRSALVSRSMLAPLALAMLPASSVTLSTELIGPSVRLVRSAVPAEASTVTWLVPSLKVTFASAPATSASMPDTVKATAVFSALLIVVSVIDSVNGAPRSALVSRSMLAPLALAMLPASSVTLSTELIGPSVRLVRSAVPAEASTVTWLVPSLKVTFASAPATSASMPDTVKATAVFSALLIVVSVIDSVNGAPRSALVSRSMLAPLALAMLPASSVTLSTELIGPSVRLVRSAVPAEASTVTWLVPSLKVSPARRSSDLASMPDTVKATAVFSALLIVVSVIDSVNGAPRSALVSRSMLAPLALAMLPASSVTLSTELIGPSVRLVRSAVPAEASTVTWLVQFGRASCRE